MIRFESNQGVRACDGVTRRDFLRAGGLALGLTLTDLARLDAARSVRTRACIQLVLVGGPGQLDTWDLKPNASEDVRGPFRPIRTRVPGIDVCEHFPLLAERMDRVALVRSVHHEEAPIHETGHQLLQTGRLSRGEPGAAHPGAHLTARADGASLPPWAIIPGPIQTTGVDVGHGQGVGSYGPAGAPLVAPGLDPVRLTRRDSLVRAVDQIERNHGDQAGALAPIMTPRAKRAFDLAAESERDRARYGWTTFGQSCLLARRLVEQGVRLVTVNMFDTVFNQVTWDCHANGGDLGSTLDDYREVLCPMFDRAYAALLDDLASTGMLEDTLVVAMGEFGRTPKINGRGGRDHWPGVWTVLFAGGGVQGGRVVGSSDAMGGEPKDRPVHAAQVASTVHHALGVPGGPSVSPIHDLF